MLEKLEKLKEEVLTNIDNIANLDDLNELKVKILGKKGEFTAIMKGMSDIAAEKIAEFGKKTNEIKTEKTKKGRVMISIGGETMSNNEQSFKRAPNVRGKKR